MVAMVNTPPSDASVAAVDLGSNSFHMIIGRFDGEQLSVIDRLRAPTRMAAGIDAAGRLSDEAVATVLESLQRFGERIAGLEPERVRATGTNSFRKARQPADLLERASEALGYPIEVLSGMEEARLIYLGVAHDRPRLEGRRLVVDIGGGSTECILGEGFRPFLKHSLHMGCVAFSRRYFPDQRWTRAEFRRAELAARLELEGIERHFQGSGWRECVGSSGTINAIADIFRESGWSEGQITLGDIKQLRRTMIAAESFDALELPGLSQRRVSVLGGGLAILKAVFESFGIESMLASEAALREGLMYDLIGRYRQEDVRNRTIRVLSGRYSVDEEQAARVEETALVCLRQVEGAWGLEPRVDGQLLAWAARMHEVGLALQHSGYHKHGSYILSNSDMPGFSRQEQGRLALLVRGHRRKLNRDLFKGQGQDWGARLMRLCVLLRLAVRLNRSRSDEPPPEFQLGIEEDGLSIAFPPQYLDGHPLTRADLEAESAALRPAGLRISVIGEGSDDR